MQWRVERFRLDLDNACLWQGDERLVLRPKTFDLLVYLVEHGGELVSKDELFAAVWPETVVSESTLTASVSELRKVLGETARAPQFIATVHRRGYRFIAPVTRVEPPASLVPQPTLEPPPVEASAAPPSLAAERRQLTVLFCDLVNSTRLAGQLDPEDWREVLQAYHQACTGVVERLDGYVAQYLGDGVLVYFGYPVAHEDDAQRAVWSGLGLLEALAALNARLALPSGYKLAVRLGVHTGLVVVSNVGTGERQEPLAQGETPHIASRLQNLAGANELVISGATRDLLGGVFRIKDLGERALRGVATPMQMYRVEGAQTVESRFEAMTVTGLTPLVGRDEELELLWRRWQQATEGEGQVVLLSGEAGLGKSRLAEALGERLADESHLQVLYQGSPYHTDSAFYPIIVHLKRTLQLDQVSLPVTQLDRLETLLAQAGLRVSEVAPLLASLLSIPSDERYAPLMLSSERQKKRTMVAWAELVVGLSHREPVLVVFEDVHWSDPTTLEALADLIDRVQEARVLLLLAFRPELTPPWNRFAHVTTLALNRLTRRQVAEMVERIAGHTVLPGELVEQIVARTDGVPLFVEELTKTVLDSVWLKNHEADGTLAGPLLPRLLPMSLRDALMARLDRLPSMVKEVAQMGAVIGREFACGLLATVCPWRADTLGEALDALVTADIVFSRGTPPEATYTFKHALIQDAAYQSLLKSTRQQYHQRIAQMLETYFPEFAATQPEVLAHHCTSGRLLEQAVDYWHQAGQHALQRSAYVEAINHITRGLEVLKSLPETVAHLRQELNLQMTIGPAVTALKGEAALEVEAIYSRARALSQQTGETPQLVVALHNLGTFYNIRGQFQAARELGEQALHLTQRVQDPAGQAYAHLLLGNTAWFLRESEAARTHIEQGISLYNPQQYRAYGLIEEAHEGVFGRCRLAQTLWYLGYPEQALQRGEEALALARELADPLNLTIAHLFVGVVCQYRREAQRVLELSETAIEIAREHGFTFRLAMATIRRGWALVEQGQGETGIAQMCQGLADLRGIGDGSHINYLVLAEAYAKEGHAEEGLKIIAEVLSDGWDPELYQLKGELLLRQVPPDAAQAEACFQQALDMARCQHAKSIELRAATSLARLWQQQSKGDEARELLAPIYGWFTEGFDTADLQDAKTLIEELDR